MQKEVKKLYTIKLSLEDYNFIKREGGGSFTKGIYIKCGLKDETYIRESENVYTSNNKNVYTSNNEHQPTVKANPNIEELISLMSKDFGEIEKVEKLSPNDKQKIDINYIEKSIEQNGECYINDQVGSVTKKEAYKYFNLSQFYDGH